MSSSVLRVPEVRLIERVVWLALDTQSPVFHPKCHGVTAAQLRKLPMVFCPQHKCSACDRSTAEAGGMLFRCVNIFNNDPV